MNDWNAGINYYYYSANYASTTVFLVLFIIVLSYIISFVVCGAVCKSINTKKGYSGGFAWGLLGIVGIIICACRNESLELRTKYLQSVLTSVLQNFAQTSAAENIVKSTGLSNGFAGNTKLQAKNNPVFDNRVVQPEKLNEESAEDSYTCPYCGKVQKKNPFGCIYCHAKT